MISPPELRKKAERLYLPFLSATIAGAPFFPKIIPCRKPPASGNFDALQRGIHQLLQQAKNTTGFGYTVAFKQVNTRLHGQQSLPDKVIFENASDFLKYLDKEEEFAHFQQALGLIVENLPNIHAWLDNKPQHVLDHLAVWPDLIKVCRYFLHHPQPELYPRQLPIEVHTKFIEQHQTILRSLLDFLLPPGCINITENNFFKHFHLRAPEALIRLRFLDLQRQGQYHFSDISIPESEFCRTAIPCDRVFVVENLMTFLAFPAFEDAIVVWGKGFQVELLAHADWLRDKAIFYWGDLDAQGLQILAQLRTYFPQTRSLMMDAETFERFKGMCVPGMPASVQELPNLTAEEKTLLARLRDQNLRLEQEKITHAYVIERLRGLCDE